MSRRRQTFAHEWLAAWNSHDLERIMSHYHEDVELRSPFMAMLGIEPSGVLRGVVAVSAHYSADAWESVP